MAIPICPKCGAKDSLERQEILIDKSRSRLDSVNCKECGVIVAIIEPGSVSNDVKIIGDKLGMNLR